jgi:A118 family predicted phage portal protein
MININQVANALNVDIVESAEMKRNLQDWEYMYLNQSSWIKKRVESLELPSAIASEFSRLTLAEFKSTLNDKTLDKQFQKLINKLSDSVEVACAFGGVLFKPYNSNGIVLTDVVRQLDFIPVSYNQDELISVVCPEYLIKGKDIYTRLESHVYNQAEHTHTVQNMCFCSKAINDLGKQCDLKEVPEWSNILPNKVYSPVDRPLFSYFKMPFANNIDRDSPLGVSVFAKAKNLIKQADIHWERILWEYESSERAIDATEELFRYNESGQPILPKGRERMFRTYDMQTTGQPFIETFSPDIRDTSLFNGLNRIFQRIEFNCGLAYGTLSDISNVEKTAEEIKTSKQRSYTNVCAIQKNLENSLKDLAYIYGYYNQYYNGFNFNAELTCTFGDSVLEDTEKEFQRRLQMVSAGLLTKEKFIAWYFNCDEKEAINYIPQSSDLFGGGS